MRGTGHPRPQQPRHAPWFVQSRPCRPFLGYAASPWVPAPNCYPPSGFRVQIETNGTLPPSPQMPTENVVIVVSPKTGSVHKDIHALATCYKYVLDPREHGSIASDGLPRVVLGHKNDGMVARPNTPRLIYVQPADVGNDFANTIIRDDVARIAMRHGYCMQLQIHKILGLE